MPEVADRYAFRPAARSDLPLIAVWLAAPHVARWWGRPADELRNIEAAIVDPTVAAFIVLIDGDPAGYLQSYAIHAEAGHPYSDQPPGSVGIDLLVGVAGLVGKGHGSRLIDAFVRGEFAAGAPRVVTDPDPENRAAIRAYARAGFRPLGTRTSIYGPALIMARDAQDQARFS
jgi:aminoglycoside 6'-N-acetyltransferase